MYFRKPLAGFWAIFARKNNFFLIFEKMGRLRLGLGRLKLTFRWWWSFKNCSYRNKIFMYNSPSEQIARNVPIHTRMPNFWVSKSQLYARGVLLATTCNTTDITVAIFNFLARSRLGPSTFKKMEYAFVNISFSSSAFPSLRYTTPMLANDAATSGCSLPRSLR